MEHLIDVNALFDAARNICWLGCILGLWGRRE